MRSKAPSYAESHHMWTSHGKKLFPHKQGVACSGSCHSRHTTRTWHAPPLRCTRIHVNESCHIPPPLRCTCGCTSEAGDMTHSYMNHGCTSEEGDMTHSDMNDLPLRCTRRKGTWPIHVWMIHTWMSSSSEMNLHASTDHAYTHRQDLLEIYGKLLVTCVHEPCHICMSHVTYEWVMSHVNGSCYIHAGFARHLSLHVKYVQESWHVCMSHVTYEWVMSRMNESCHVWMSHVTYEWVMSHTCRICSIFRGNRRISRLSSSLRSFCRKFCLLCWPSALKISRSVAVCCSVLQCVLQCVAVCGSCDCTRLCSVFAESFASYVSQTH